jgi:hypothetical protein
MDKKLRELIDQVKTDIEDGMPQEAFDSLIEGLCIYCSANHLQDDCPLATLLLEVLDDEIESSVHMMMAKHIINHGKTEGIQG